jgi:hypothetical protein
MFLSKSLKKSKNLFQRNLYIHEYQGKELMKKYDIAHQRGFIATNVEEGKIQLILKMKQ